MRWTASVSTLLLSILLACSSGEKIPAGQEAPPPAEPKAQSKAPDSESVDALRDEARSKVKAFAGSLKGELMAAMKEGGPTKAIEVCNTRAPAITEAASTQGWTLARRSTRLRNPDNRADEWERVQLNAFALRLASGEAVQEIDEDEIADEIRARIGQWLERRSA